MNIRKVTGDKKEYIDLLLLADEQEDMIDNYLERGEMFVLDDNGVKGECVVTREAAFRIYDKVSIGEFFLTKVVFGL